jgi:hypothetical protein
MGLQGISAVNDNADRSPDWHLAWSTIAVITTKRDAPLHNLSMKPFDRGLPAYNVDT